jgi:hypothetical protein
MAQAEELSHLLGVCWDFHVEHLGCLHDLRQVRAVWSGESCAGVPISGSLVFCELCEQLVYAIFNLVDDQFGEQ